MRTPVQRIASVLLASLLAMSLGGCAWINRSSLAGSTQGNGDSGAPAVSADGHFVAFASTASNWIATDTNGVSDIYVRDHVANTVERVSIPGLGGEANGPSFNPAISEDGRFVAFESDATNLVLGDSNAVRDGFVRDTVAATTTRVTVATGGTEANGPSFHIKINEFGNYTAFESDASNLVPSATGAGDTNQVRDVFFHDNRAVTTQRVSVQTGGGQSNGPSFDPSISGDAPYVAFDSEATNLAPGDIPGRDVFVHNRLTIVTEPITLKSTHSERPSISLDQRYVSFQSDDPTLVPGDTNGVTDVFVKDRATGVTRRDSTQLLLGEANGASAQADISSDGRYVTFASNATNLDSNTTDTNGKADVFLRAAIVPTVTSVVPVSAPPGASVAVTINGAGFRPNAQVLVSTNDITVGPVTVVNDSTITTTFNITATAALGPRNVLVGNVGTGPGLSAGAMGLCSGCFSVT